MRHRSELRTCFTAALALSILAGSAQAQPQRTRAKRPIELRAPIGEPHLIYATRGGFSHGPLGGTDCTQISTHTDFNFTSGGNANMQAGFAQQESAAVSFTLAPDAFPIKIRTAEILFATQAQITTTTRWTVRIWQGTPTSGAIVHTESSDGTFLPHIVITPPQNNALLVYQIDPNDPNQVLVNNNGSNTFTVEFRVDQHHNPPANPCDPPNQNTNAFPTTDTSGLAAPAGNWLRALECGPLACPGGWYSFQNYPSFCRPTGDWIIRASFEPTNCGTISGACCFANGSCQFLTAAACAQQGGAYQGDNILCANANCASPTGACCFPQGGCTVLNLADCNTIGGTFQGAGTQCAGNACPVGACCLPSGSCIGNVTTAQCTAQGGVFQGNNSTCGTVNCPQPTGACCAPNGACLNMTQANCAVIPGVWAGPGSTCAGTNCQTLLCYPNCDQSTQSPILNIADFSCFLTKFAGGHTYANCDNSTQEPTLNVADFSCFLTKFAAGCN